MDLETKVRKLKLKPLTDEIRYDVAIKKRTSIFMISMIITSLIRMEDSIFLKRILGVYAIQAVSERA